MMNQSEITDHINAVSRFSLSLRDEILQIIGVSQSPLCCREI